MPDENWTAMGKPRPWPELDADLTPAELAAEPEDDQRALVPLPAEALDPKRFTA